jgi:long-subunit acyl-CoA synthetase (AMP-forming)
MTAIVCTANYIPDIVSFKNRNEISTISNIICVGVLPSTVLREEARGLGITIHSYDELLAAPRPPVTPDAPTGDSIYTICYTSGTTG